MRKVGNLLLAVALGAGLPAMAMAQNHEGHERGGEHGGGEHGRGGGERGGGQPSGVRQVPQAQPQAAPAPQVQVQAQQRPQGFPGGRPDQRQGQRPQDAGRGDQRPQGFSDGRRFDVGRPDQGNRGDFRRDDRRPDAAVRVEGRQDDQRRFEVRGDDRRRFDGRPGDDRRFDGNRGFDNNRGYDRGPGGGGDRWVGSAWRNDRRYNWQGLRAANRGRFQIGRYNAPRGWGYGYRRFGVGVTLPGLFWASDYWLSDASYYGLPPAYGPYRWVRYYSDVLLIDVRDGRIVDEIPNFFF